MSWNEHDLTTETERLEALLRQDDRFALYELRAIATLLERVQTQLQALDESEPSVADPSKISQRPDGDEPVRAVTTHLRRLERDLLERCLNDLEQQLYDRRHVDLSNLIPGVAAAVAEGGVSS